MAQIKVCPACKNLDTELTFYFMVILKQIGYILINEAEEESYETFDSDYTSHELTPSTPVKCECGWIGIAKNLLVVEEESNGTS